MEKTKINPYYQRIREKNSEDGRLIAHYATLGSFNELEQLPEGRLPSVDVDVNSVPSDKFQCKPGKSLLAYCIGDLKAQYMEVGFS